MKTLLTVLFAGMSLFAGLAPNSANAQEKFYYWVSPFPNSRIPNPESFVVEVDAARKAQIEAILAEEHAPQLLSRIAAGSVPYNKNYHAPGQPVWNWHVAFIDDILDQSDGPFSFIDNVNGRAHPSDIAANPEQWIAQNGDRYFAQRYYIRQQIDPSKPDALLNVSNRGITDGGEKTLITGFIVKGGEPRSVVVRALGPSLSASGVQQVAANPKIAVFQGSRRIAENADWKTDARADDLSESYPELAPADDNEAALLLTLLPGAYTLHGLNEDAAEGIVLLEAYDVDSASE